MSLKMRIGCTSTLVNQWVATLLPSDTRLADFPHSALGLSSLCCLLAHPWPASLVSIAPCPAGTGVCSCLHRADYNYPLYSKHFHIGWPLLSVRKSEPIFQMEKLRPKVKPLTQYHTATSVLSGNSFMYAKALDLVCNQLWEHGNILLFSRELWSNRCLNKQTNKKGCSFQIS